MKLDMDSLGFALSLDLLLALIPLTIILGIVAADMDSIMYQMEDVVFRGSTDRVAADTMNTLVKTSGTPTQWELTGNPTVVGLAKYNNATGRPYTGLLSPTKIYALNSSHVQDIVGNYSYFFDISLADSGVSIKNLTNSPTGAIPSNATDVVRVQKVAQSSKYETVSSLEGWQVVYSGAGRPYTAPSFSTNYYYNQTYDYWIFMQSSGFTSMSVTINNFPGILFASGTAINTPYLINSSYLNVNASNPNGFYANTVKLNGTGSLDSKLNFYIIQTPKGTPQSDVNSNTALVKDYRITLYIWPK